MNIAIEQIVICAHELATIRKYYHFALNLCLSRLKEKTHEKKTLFLKLSFFSKRLKALTT